MHSLADDELLDVENLDAWADEVLEHAFEGELEDLNTAMADPRMNLQIKCDAFQAALDGLQSETATFLAERLHDEPLDDLMAREVALLRACGTRDREAFAAGIRDSQLSASAIQTAISGGFTVFDEEELVELLREPAFTPAEPNLSFLKAIALRDQATVAQALADPQVEPGQNGSIALTVAAAAGEVDIVKMLVRDPRLRNLDRDARIGCIAIRNSEVLWVFLQHSSGLVIGADSLLEAARLGHVDSLRVALSYCNELDRAQLVDELLQSDTQTAVREFLCSYQHDPAVRKVTDLLRKLWGLPTAEMALKFASAAQSVGFSWSDIRQVVAAGYFVPLAQAVFSAELIGEGLLARSLDCVRALVGEKLGPEDAVYLARRSAEQGYTGEFLREMQSTGRLATTIHEFCEISPISDSLFKALNAFSRSAKVLVPSGSRLDMGETREIVAALVPQVPADTVWSAWTYLRQTQSAGESSTTARGATPWIQSRVDTAFGALAQEHDRWESQGRDKQAAIQKEVDKEIDGEHRLFQHVRGPVAKAHEDLRAPRSTTLAFVARGLSGALLKLSRALSAKANATELARLQIELSDEVDRYEDTIKNELGSREHADRIEIFAALRQLASAKHLSRLSSSELADIAGREGTEHAEKRKAEHIQELASTPSAKRARGRDPGGPPL